MAFETISLGTQPAGTGGDTARTAFEKVNRNFIAADVLAAAMSQAQFEANRNANKELDAASGWVSFGNHESGKQVNECKPGLYTTLTTPNTLLIGKAGGVGGSKTDHGVLNIAGVIFHLPLAYQVKLAPAPDGKTTYNKANGVVTRHATVAAAFNAQAVDPVNVEVVIYREDLWGFEAFPQKVTAENPEIYPQGVFSYLFTSMNGIPTSDSSRPVSYFGFLGAKAKKVDFFTLSDYQKKKVLSDPENNLHYSEDGSLIQWVLRGREFAGVGNGSWSRVDSAGTQGVPSLSFNNLSRIGAQGIMDTPHPINSGGITEFRSTESSANNYPEVGLFTLLNQSSDIIAENEECYFLVCGTVSRLGQCAYHPSFNTIGTKAITDTYGDQNTSALWHNVTGTTSAQFNSTAASFDPQVVLLNSGYAGNPLSAIRIRPDKRFYDAIYADGQGGVCRDIRYSSYGKNPVDFDDNLRKVEMGKYRGFELLRFTKVFSSSAAAIADGYTIQDETNSVAVVAFKLLPNYVGGAFMQTDVIAPPASILTNAALTNGWQGNWGGVPSAGGIGKSSTRKMIASGTIIYSINNGATWITAESPQPSPTNNVTTTGSDSEIHICQYQAFARQTRPAINSSVYGGSMGLGDVINVRFHGINEGALLQESLIGYVNTDELAFITRSKLQTVGLRADGHLVEYPDYASKHNELMFNSNPPVNDSRSVKALHYNYVLGHQANIKFAYTELRFSGSSWGDDGKINAVSNQASKLDLNNNTVQVGTAELCELIGWVFKRA
ncbi:hypothetical protein G3495_11090 [Shewanella baltica]|uniref:hypothetical protein n=1 Tax=Shewanella baltica TaxID=62322 RepID=UPI00217D1C24|nr:hypothetical protein [Shewanella baltica]MCS6235666.1 hypothetical protein [Shewanella baltica]MCS6270171.1 hypothetical protein [Shewanella baltica]